MSEKNKMECVERINKYNLWGAVLSVEEKLTYDVIHYDDWLSRGKDM